LGNGRLLVMTESRGIYLASAGHGFRGFTGELSDWKGGVWFFGRGAFTVDQFIYVFVWLVVGY